MTKWDVELCCGIGFTVNDVDAPTRDEAIKQAIDLVTDNTTILTDISVDKGDLEYDQCMYSKQHKGKWTVELSFGIGFTVSNVEAPTQQEAAKKAKDLVLEDTMFMTDPQVEKSDLEFEQYTYFKEI